MRSTMKGASLGSTHSCLIRGPSSLRVKPFTRLNSKFDAQTRSRQSVRPAAAETEDATAAAEAEAEGELFDFNFTSAKKNNEYTPADVEAAMAYFRKEGSQPESDKDHLSNEFGDEDATYFAALDRGEGEEDDNDDAEFVYAGISEAAGGGSSGFDIEMFERLKEAREAESFQSLSDSAVMDAAMDQDYGNKRGASTLSVDQVDQDGEAVEDEDEDEGAAWDGPLGPVPEFNPAANKKLGSWNTNVGFPSVGLDEYPEPDSDDEDPVADPSLPAEKEYFVALREAEDKDEDEVNDDLELLGLADLEEVDGARGMMELMKAQAFLDEDDDDDEGDENEPGSLIDLDDGVWKALEEFSDWTYANNFDLQNDEDEDDEDEEDDGVLRDEATGRLLEYYPSEPSAIMNEAEIEDLEETATYIEEDIEELRSIALKNSGIAELLEEAEDDDGFVAFGDDQIWKEIYENSMEMKARPMPDIKEELIEDDGDQWSERILEVARVTTVRRGGKVQGFRASAVVGNGKGKVGVGCGGGGEIGVAVKRALVDAKKKVITIPLVGKGTIPHVSEVKFGAAHVKLLPASDGTGVIAGSTIKAVLEVAGVKNVLSKRLGCRSLMNNARATVKALSMLKTLNMVSAYRGIPMDELLLPRKSKK